MSRRLVLLAVAAFTATIGLEADSGELKPLLKNVEKRYNSAKTIRVLFEQTYTPQGKPPRLEKGELFLRKPGRMRWEYTLPAGKLFQSDGKYVYFYSPSTNRVEKSRLKESEDMRAPLAFLLGKLDFDRDFTNYQARDDASGTVIRAVPKNDRLPYTSVDFTVSPDSEITRLLVTGQDNTVVEFRFAEEKINPPMSDKLFQFRLPQGAQLVETEDIGEPAN
jgi:outer membrane lipoprotein carrier protein